VIKSPETNYSETTALSSKEFQKKISEKFEIGGSYKGFSASLTTGFEKSITNASTNSFTAIENYSHYYFTILDLEKFKLYLKADVKRAINSGDANRIFEQYGTHFLAGIVYGAKASISLTFDKYENNITSETTVNAQANFMDMINGSTTVSTNTGSKISLSSGQIKVKTFGGNTNINPESLLKEDGFDKWVESITLDNSALVDFSTNGSQALVGIWELADTPERRDFLKIEANKFLETHQTDDMYRSPVDYLITIKTGNKDYAGTGNFVSIEIFGQYGTTGKIDLYGKGHFEKGKTTDFQYRCDDLGGLTKIVINNENYSHSISNPGWLLDKVEIIAGATELTKKNPHCYSNQFNFYNWLKEDKGYKTSAIIEVAK